LGDQVLDAIEEIFESRKSRYLGNGTQGQIVKDLETQFSKLDDQEISEKGLLNLMVLIPQGRRATFDKKTHRRVWQRTTRMTYIYLAAGLLEGREPEQVAEDVLSHLEEVQAVIRRVWGLSEISRLAAVRPVDLDEDVSAGLLRSLGEQTFQQIGQQPLQTLKGDLLEQVVDELGRSALTKLYRQLLLRVISELWVEYLTQMEALRVSIGLEAYAQRDPLVQYKTRAFQMFQDLLSDMRMSVVTRMFTFQPRDLSSVQASVTRQEPPPIREKSQPSRASRGKRRRRRRRR
jgi:preprotein translocase subunit SecA